jgi:hypothetical protein
MKKNKILFCFGVKAVNEPQLKDDSVRKIGIETRAIIPEFYGHQCPINLVLRGIKRIFSGH